jgi:ribosomal protein L11 methyltransferase
MAWVSVAITVEADLAERLADALLEGGALSVDVSDAHAGDAMEQPIFDEPDQRAEGSHWNLNLVSALFDEQVDHAEALARASAVAGLDAVPPVQVTPVGEQDWVRTTQAQFQPIAISHRLWIVPSWSQPPDPDAIILRLDPGLAFGTGSHPTTWQCLQWLDTNLQPGESVLDYGCGSGVLAIAAKRLGAGEVIGVDIDPNAIRASRDNAVLNAVAVQFDTVDGLPARQFDVVVANILANPLRALAPLLASHSRPGGRIVLAGILEAQAAAVESTYAQWFDLRLSAPRDGWVCVSGERHR